MAQGMTHCGRSGDVATALEWIANFCPNSITYLVGFSLGAVIALNLAAEIGSRPCGKLAGVLAVGPAVDLTANRRHFDTLLGRPYDRFFVRQLWRQLLRRAARHPNSLPLSLSRRPRCLYEFDEWITAPLGGFASADEYYELTSPAPKLQGIIVPTLILAAEDDPVVCIEPLKRCCRSSSVEVMMTRSGGHLGYVAAGRHDPDRRWLDWRVVEWILGRGDAVKVT
jgi:predicted alpha/beta-fold hydrolase